MDDVHGDVIEKPQGANHQPAGQKTFEHATEARARTLLGGRNTITSLLRRPEHAGAFRLKALADAFFEPLDAFLADRDYMLETEGLSALDYKTFGYLSLMLYPHMPQQWLADIMRKRYPRLVRYCERVSKELGLRVRVGSHVAQATPEEDPYRTDGLPWTLPEAQGVAKSMSFIAEGIYQHLTFLPQTRWPSTEVYNGIWSGSLPSLIACISTSFAITGFWLYRNGIWPRGDAIQIFGRRRLADYGEAGAALAALGGQFKAESIYQQQQSNHSPIQVDVEIDEQPLS